MTARWGVGKIGGDFISGAARGRFLREDEGDDIRAFATL